MSERYPAPYAGGPPPGAYDPTGQDYYYGYGPIESPEASGAPAFNIRSLLGILRRNIWLILISTAIGLAGGVFVGSRAIPQYRASAAVQLVDPQRGVGSALRTPQLTAISGVDLFGSQFEVLRSQAVLGQVVAETGLRLRPLGEVSMPAAAVFTTISVDSTVRDGDTLTVEFGSQISARLGNATTSGGYGEVIMLPGIAFTVLERPAFSNGRWQVRSIESAVSYITRGLEARRRGMTDIVDVRFTSTHPVEAARVVNSAVYAFQRYDATTSRQQLELQKDFIEDQLARTDSLLVEAQKELSDFYRANPVQRLQTRMQAYESQVVQFELQRYQLQNDLDFYRRLLAQLEGSEPGLSEELEIIITTPGILNHPIASSQFSALTGYVSERRRLITGEGRSETAAEVVRLDSLIALTHRQLIHSLNNYVQGLEVQAEQLELLRRQSAGTAERLQLPPELELEAQRLIQQVSMLNSQAEQLRSARQSAMMADAIEVGQIQILDEARPPSTPLSTNTRRARTAGVAFGLLLGLAGAGLREGINNTIRGRKDLEKSLNTTGIAVIPPLTKDGKPRRTLKLLKGARSNGSQKERLVTLYDSRSVGADAFRTLRTNLVLNRTASRMKTLLVTSAAPSEGKSTIASNLAVTFAQQGVNTLLVDCDVRHPSLDRIFEVDRRPGLTDWVTARNLFSECVRKTATEHLWFLPAGSLPSNPVEFLGGERMRSALQALSDKFEMVILDTCPVLAAADPIVLGVAVDGIIVVTRVNQTKRVAAQHTVEKLTRVGGRVLGVVLNDPDSALEIFDDYGYGYAYYSYYGDEPEDQNAPAGKA